MAEIIGNLATGPEPRESQGSKEKYFTFRLAENSGKGDSRRTTWYDVRAKLKDTEADLLSTGHLVRIRGRLEPQAYIKKQLLADIPVPNTWEEIIKVLKQHNALGSSMILLTSSVEPYQFQRREQDAAA